MLRTPSAGCQSQACRIRIRSGSRPQGQEPVLRLGVGGGEEENSRGGFDSLARKQEVEGRAGSGSRGPGFGPGVLVPDTWASSISDLRMFTCGIKVWLSISREATGLPPKSLRGFFKQYFFPTFLQLVESPGHKDSRP